MTALLGTCAERGCKVTTTGLCVNGVKPASRCPRFEPAAPARPAASVTVATPPAAAPAVTPPASAKTRAPRATQPLPSGEALDFASGNRIVRAERSRIILLAGARRSGKTTLALSLYELYQRGPFAGMRFAASETLVAFERLCHAARVRSEGDAPDTLRTELEAGTQLLHLRLRPQAGQQPPVNLLFADLSGEHYERACNETEECKKLIMMSRADHVAILLDGARLSQQNQGAHVFKETRGLLSSALDAGMLGRSSTVRILFAKCDRLGPEPQNMSTLRRIRDKLSEDFAARLGRLDYTFIAARPDRPTAELPLGHGLSALLSEWVEPPPPISPPPPHLVRFTSQRQSERYLEVRLPHLFSEES